MPLALLVTHAPWTVLESFARNWELMIHATLSLFDDSCLMIHIPLTLFQSQKCDASLKQIASKKLQRQFRDIENI